jgi:hypothetical protein
MTDEQHFKGQLLRQMSFLITSCELFDAGRWDEAIRIATSVRVLFYDTGKSTSILQHLGLKRTLKLMSTCRPLPVKADSVLFLEGMVTWRYHADGNATPLSPLGSREVWRELSFKSWWDETISIIPPKKTRITRGSLVLGAANKDGGAHVDRVDQFEQVYKAVTDGYVELGETRFQASHLIMLRQIGYEVSNSPMIAKILTQ